jgi:hypothetical protein
MTKNTNPGMPTPHPMLKSLDKFIGVWSMSGHLVDADEEILKGEATYEWLPGGFFLKQHVKMTFMGMTIDSTELVGYDPETDGLKSFVYSNMSPVPLPYFWNVDGDDVKISVSYGPLDATMHANFDKDGQSYSGGWRPNEGADANINVPYDISGKRLK